MTALILYDSTKSTVAVSPEFEALKSAALELVSEITEIKSDAENEAANRAVGEVSALKKRIEKAHKEAKALYWTACKALDEKKNEVIADLDREELRVNRLCGNWVQDQLEKQREAERERSRQLEKIEQQVAAGKIEPDVAAQERAAVAEIAPMAKAAGQTVKVRWSFKVTNIFDLVRARPDLCTIEPKTREINELINDLEVRKIPGVDIFEEVKIHARKPGLKILEV